MKWVFVMVFSGFRFSVRFLTVGLAAGVVTVIVILRLTPFKFAVTVAAPFFFGTREFSEMASTEGLLDFAFLMLIGKLMSENSSSITPSVSRMVEVVP